MEEYIKFLESMLDEALEEIQTVYESCGAKSSWSESIKKEFEAKKKQYHSTNKDHHCTGKLPF